MVLIETIVVAFSMFSALPMPHVEWNAKNMRFSLCAFPLVGVVIGLAGSVWWAICSWFSLPSVLRGVGLCLLPVGITGGIHLDGYADTCDALASHAPLEKKQEILKDAHLGTLAVIHLCGYFLASFALWSTLLEWNATVIIASFCLSRTLSGLAITCFPLARDTGLAHTFAEAADKKTVKKILLGMAAFFACVLAICGKGWMMLVFVVTFAYYHRMARKQFGGLSGDLAGWFVQTAELWALIALIAVQYGGKIL